MKPTKEQAQTLVHIYNKTLSDTVEAMRKAIEHWEAIRPPAPLTFGDPPHGWAWHNPGNLTPEQVEVDKGWRLMLVGEIAKKPHDHVWIYEWEAVNGLSGTVVGISSQNDTFRTKAPLPAPKPTQEELEKREFEEWWRSNCASYSESSGPIAFRAWQAARKTISAPSSD